MLADVVTNEIHEGRWLSPDPLGGDITNPQSLNRYAYVLNNPTTLTDPSGLDPCDNDPNTCVTVTATPPPDINFFVFGRVAQTSPCDVCDQGKVNHPNGER